MQLTAKDASIQRGARTDFAKANMKLQPLMTMINGQPFGMEVSDVDLSRELDDATIQGLRDAFYRYGVLLFRGQALSEAQHVAFSRHFGELRGGFHPQYNHPAHPEILVLTNKKKDGKPLGIMDAGRVFHTDLSFTPEPAFGSILYGIEVPVGDDGKPMGDTLYVSSAAAYDDLPEAMKKKVDGLRAIHKLGARKRAEGDLRTEEQRRQDLEEPEVVHPVIRTHHVTGQKSIYVVAGECTGIVGMPDNEALPLLQELADFITRPANIYAHQWRVGDVVMWDNITTQHSATFDPTSRQIRYMHRTTLRGTTPF